MKQQSIQDDDNRIAFRTENILTASYWFGEIDTRWLSVFRILLGLLILKDAIYHLPLARIFYSDEGVIPRKILFDGLVRDNRFSLMDAMGRPWMAFLFFCVWIIVLILLIVGYRVRLMTILNFIIILSVHERNGYILTSSDTLIRAMCFWMIFAPVGQYYSIDAIRRRWQGFRERGETAQFLIGQETRTAFALPLRMIQLQFVIVYISTAYLKAISPIWQAGEAMHYVVQIDTFILPFGAWMRNWSPELLKALSYYSLYAEIAIPILLLLPFVWRWSRSLAFILALILHGGIAVTLSIQDFSILMLICYLPFFDPAWLEWIFNIRQIRNLQEWVGEKVFAHYQKYPPVAPVQSRRHWANRRVYLSALLLPLFSLLIMWNIEATGAYLPNGFQYPRPVERVWKNARNVIWYTGLWQYWDMFSPTPIQYDGWLVVEGYFENDSSYDLFTKQAIDYEHPTRWYWGPQMRWEKYEENIYRGRYDALLRGFAGYYCRSINDGRIESIRLANIRIVMNVIDFHSPNEFPHTHQQEQLWYHWCYDEYAPEG